jgi:endogenous inhibitor of DNA gyrase (YacG/DUF329 family)
MKLMTSQDQARPCAICGKPQVERFRPFCSRRCADVDLHRWLTGVYAVPTTEEDDSAPSDDPGER